MRIFLLLAVVTGCLGEDDIQSITATWHLTSITGDPVGCPAGASAELVETFTGDQTFTSCGAESVSYTTGEGLLNSVYIEVTSADHATPFARSPSTAENGVALVFSDSTFDTEILVDGGYFQFSWQFARADTTLGQCGDDGITDVAIEATLVDATVGIQQHFSCAAPRARLALAPGRYLVTISALDAQRQIVGSPHRLGEQLILDPDKLSPVSDLGLITLAIP